MKTGLPLGSSDRRAPGSDGGLDDWELKTAGGMASIGRLWVSGISQTVVVQARIGECQ